MVDASVAAPAPVFGRPDFQWPVGLEKSPFAQVLSQCRLKNGRERRGSLLGLEIVVHSFGQVVRKSHGGSFHASSIAPIGEAGEVGAFGEMSSVSACSLLALRALDKRAPRDRAIPISVVLPY